MNFISWLGQKDLFKDGAEGLVVNFRKISSVGRSEDS